MACATKHTYPMGARQNYNVLLYADIALRNYIRSKEQYEKLDFSINGCEEDISFDLFSEYTISTIVFSTMCMEAFLNDYAAACLGDDEFYGYFDKLSIEGKFALIGKFILSTEIDKSKSYYYRLKRLVRDRNGYTHIKSSVLKGNETLEEAGYLRQEALECMEKLGIDKQPYQDMLDSAKNGLCAIRDMAYFFDAHDAGVDAIARLFCIGGAIIDGSGKEVRSQILQELHIKNKVVCS